MSDVGDKLHKAYGAMSRDEPGAALDAAILAASRQALAKPSASRRWAAPVSIAAVLVLAFGVTLRMQQEKPGVESPDVYPSPPASASAPAAAPPVQNAAEPSPVPKPVESRQAPQHAARAQPGKKIVTPAAKPDVAQDVATPQAKLQAAPAQALPKAFEEDMPQRRDDARMEAEQKQKDTLRKEAATAAPAAPPAAAASIAAAPAPAPAASGAPAARMKSEAFAPQANTGVRGVAADELRAVDEPTRELEAIAKLRAEGRNEEADKALAEFRKKRPDFVIPAPMWERVKPR